MMRRRYDRGSFNQEISVLHAFRFTAALALTAVAPFVVRPSWKESGWISTCAGIGCTGWRAICATYSYTGSQGETVTVYCYRDL